MPVDPVLVLPGTDLRYPLAGRARFAVGRSREADIPVRDPRCSRKQFELQRVADGWQLVPVSPDTPTVHNGIAIHSPTALANGDRIAAGDTVFEFQDSVSGAQTLPPKSISTLSQRTILAGDLELPLGDGLWLGQPVPVGSGLLIGRDPTCGLVLKHPLVSRRHARIAVKDAAATVTDLVSANGTFVNGRAVNGTVALNANDRIDVGPYTLRFTGTHLAPTSRAGNIELQGWRITRTVIDRTTGKPLKLLDDVSLLIRPGQFVCLLGPSGSGKSTLLAALSGRAKPDRGKVLVNATDLYETFDVVKRELAVVPQKDLLFDTLTVNEALRYTARLRLPPDSTAADVQREVDDLLQTVGLETRKHIPIRQLSGGQLKRVSLANELMGRPSLIFLDEVTSGLDEQTDRDMMALFRKMADGGKTVVCVTHSLAHVDRSCHAVVVLAPGGVLAFAGSPSDAKDYFHVERLGDVYEALNEKTPDEWRVEFEGHPNAVTQTDLPTDNSTEQPVGGGMKATAKEATRQGWVLFRRRVRLLLRDRPALFTVAMQTAVVAAALAIVYGDLSKVENPVLQARDTVTLYFLLAVSSFWFGCNGAVKVLVADRPMYRRERAVNLSPWGYGGATFIVFCGLTIVQTVALAGAVWWTCHPPGMGWPAVGILALASATGTALGLALSAGSGSEEQAVAAVPLALIPQIVFGGAIVALGGFAEWLAKVGVTVYWTHRANLGLLPADLAERAGVDQSGQTTAVLMLTAHLLAFTVAATAIVLYRDARTFRG